MERVCTWPIRIAAVDTHLVELPLSAFLRTLVTKPSAGVPEALNSVKQAVLDGRADATCGSLGAQRQAVAVHRILPGEHLLLDDVGHLAEAAHEQRRRLISHIRPGNREYFREPRPQLQ